ncbi:hypothetical protein RHSIM_RhsimUnG0016200 [Rhododendron simsii]|uniref:Aminotransferase-like plant mobile domain-containing protein n=1 Tax=Rhododendron simsii TaxID=118357 RepID=A0A834L344_RHOSS|nr:hypothetical protein RHSIM_RhsimUnG0016200 [Rhododendron simsii]
MSGTTINWVYVRYMEDLNKIKQFDWAGAICNYLLKSTHVEHKDPKEVKDSSILLLYWLCEHSNILNQESPDSIPRLLKWNITKLRKTLKDVKQLQQLPDEKVKNGTLEQTIEEKVEYEFKKHKVQQDQVQQDAQEKDETKQHEVVNGEFVELVQTQFEVQQDEGEKVKVAEVENVSDSCGLLVSDVMKVTSPKYNSDSTLEPNTLSGKSLPKEEDECLKKLVDIILDDSKKYAPAMLDESTEERYSINDNLTKKIEYLEK